MMKDKLLEKYMRLKIKQANELIDFSKFQASKYPDRSIAIQITDLGDNVGFGFDPKSMKIVELKEIKKPTILVRCSSRVFKAILAGKIDPDEIFYGNIVEVYGKHLMRDKIILSEMFDAFRKVGFIKAKKNKGGEQ